MPAFTYRTLGELRQTVRARIGQQAAGASAGASVALIDSFLSTAQREVYELQDWKKLTEYEDLTIGVGQNLLDYPTDANPERLVTPKGSRSPIWVLYSGKWIPILEGISADHWDSMDDQDTYPTRYERHDQLMFWPKSNAIYTLKVWYIKKLERFTQDNDRASVDDDLILLHAIAHAKAHYKQSDAQAVMGQWERMKASVRGHSTGSNGVFSFRGRGDEAPLPKPTVV